MRRSRLVQLFIVIAAVQVAATFYAIVAEGRIVESPNPLIPYPDAWLNTVARIAEIALLLPLGPPVIMLWSSLSDDGGFNLLAVLPNALLWAAVICWLLNRLAYKLHSRGRRRGV